MFRVNERRYEFGDEEGSTIDDWVCAKIPNDGRVKKDCVPKVCFVSFHFVSSLLQNEAPGWYVDLLTNRDYKVTKRDVIFLIGTSDRHSSRSAFGRSTGNDVEWPL